MLNTHGDELRKRQLDLAELNQEGLPAWVAPFIGFDAPERFWAPARAALLSYIGLPSDAESVSTKRRKPVVTFVSMADEPYEAGAHIRTEDYPDLVAGLEKLAKQGIVSEFHIVKNNGTKESWEERMKIITRTDVSPPSLDCIPTSDHSLPISQCRSFLVPSGIHSTTACSCRLPSLP